MSNTNDRHIYQARGKLGYPVYIDSDGAVWKCSKTDPRNPATHTLDLNANEQDISDCVRWYTPSIDGDPADYSPYTKNGVLYQ